MAIQECHDFSSSIDLLYHRLADKTRATPSSKMMRTEGGSPILRVNGSDWIGHQDKAEGKTDHAVERYQELLGKLRNHRSLQKYSLAVIALRHEIVQNSKIMTRSVIDSPV